MYSLGAQRMDLFFANKDRLSKLSGIHVNNKSVCIYTIQICTGYPAGDNYCLTKNYSLLLEGILSYFWTKGRLG